MQKFSNDEPSSPGLQNVNAGMQSDVLDTIPPIITLIGKDTVRIPNGDPENLLQGLKTQYRVVDNSDPVPVVVIQADMSVLFPDTSEMHYIATDKSGNQSSIKRMIIVLPAEIANDVPPVINVTMIDLQIYTGEPFDPLRNVTAYDDMVGDLTDRIRVSGKVNTNVAGKYLLTYSVKDRSGNTCILNRTITVIEDVHPDETFPVITLKGDKTMYIYENQAYIEPGYSAFDTLDGDITANVVVYSSVKSNPGTYSITYTVADKAMNITTTTRIVVRKAGSMPDTVKLSVRVPGN
jgi:hypothetical protein